LIENVNLAALHLEAEITPPPAGDAGLIFRVSRPSIGADAYEGYYAGISASSKQVILGRADGRNWIPLKIVDCTIPADNSTKLSVIARGNRIEVRLNDEATPIISITDNQWTAGQAGVRIYTTDNDRAVSAFDNVRVDPLSEGY
jgi:hypothetical protein